jgi:CRISPR-associated protein Cas4
MGLMDDYIIISNLNDFIFCPASIYFHNLYGSMDTFLYQGASQINGTDAHKSLDNGTYSEKKNIITGLAVYSEQYNLVGKIDLYDSDSKILTERKKKIKTIYEGYIFQIYAQYFAMKEMGYEVRKLRFYSMDDNKSYPVILPENDLEMKCKFEETINKIKCFEMDSFVQTNFEKCKKCIYEPACDRGLT